MEHIGEILKRVVNEIPVDEQVNNREEKYIVYIGIFGVCCFIAVGAVLFSIFHGF